MSSAAVKLHPGVDTWDSRLSSLLDGDQKDLIDALAAFPHERPYPKHLAHTSEISCAVLGEEDYEELSTTQGPVESLPMLENWFKSVEDSILDEKEMQVVENSSKFNLSVT